jgi:hypothetical protein
VADLNDPEVWVCEKVLPNNKRAAKTVGCDLCANAFA